MKEETLKIYGKDNQKAKLWQVLEALPVGIGVNIDSKMSGILDNHFLSKLSDLEVSLNSEVEIIKPENADFVGIFTTKWFKNRKEKDKNNG